MAWPDSSETLNVALANSTSQTGTHPTHHNDLARIVNAIMTELGLTPSGSAATVRERFEGLEQLLLSAQVASYTLLLTDASKLVGISNAGSVNLTIPPNSSVAFPVGTQILLRQVGAGQITIVAGAGVTINSRGAAFKLAGQWAYATLIKVATDTWDVSGDVTT